MGVFQYYAPTRVVFGENAEAQVGTLVAKQGAKKVLIHYGSGSVIRSGLLARVRKSLDEAGIPHVELGGVVPNPRMELAYQGMELARAEQVDFVLAVGGGSTIDSAKTIAYGAVNDGDVWDFFVGKRQAVACLPVGVVLTLAATGSEMSNSAAMTNGNGALKRGYNNDMARPVFAVMNPALTMTLPAYQTACGCADIMMHTMERYFNGCPVNMEMTDTIAEGLVRIVMKNALILMESPENYQARAEVMWAGSLSHNGLTGFGTDNGDWMPHKMSHELSGLYDLTHGAVLTALWGSWARYVLPSRPERFAQFAANVTDLHGDTPEQSGLMAIEAMEAFFQKLGLPTSIRAMGVDPSQAVLEEMAHKCASAMGGRGGSIRKLDETDILRIYQMAMG